MRSVNLAEAKARLSALIREAADGEAVSITSRGKPVAQLVAARRTYRKVCLDELRAISAATPPQDEDAALLLRRMRDDARF